MKRREFLKTAGGVALAGVCCGVAGACGDVFAASSGVDGASEPALLDVDALFEANSPEVLALAERVMEKCVLEKIMAPTPPLKHTWIVPGGPYYKGQWMWDTMFVVDLLSILPGSWQNHRIAEGVWLLGGTAAVKPVVGVVLAVLVGVVIIGGIRRIAVVASRIVPFMCIVYTVGALTILLKNIEAIPVAFAQIFRYAFTPVAAGGGAWPASSRSGGSRSNANARCTARNALRPSSRSTRTEILISLVVII